MDTLRQDVHYTLRSLYRRPLFSAIAILTLALGIGANTAVFSVVNAALLRALPFPAPDRIVKVGLTTPEEPDVVWSYPKYDLLRAEQTVFSHLAGYAEWQGNLAGDGEAERLLGERVTAQYFDLLGATPRLGRAFTEEEAAEPGRAGIAVLSDALWHRRFNADPAVVGRTIQLDGEAITVVGIAPPGFRGLTGGADLFLPMSTIGRMMAGEFAHFMTVVARMKDGVTIERAKSEVAVLGKRINEQYRSPRDDAEWGADARLLEELRVDPAIRRSVLVLFGAVSGVLLIACANMANLLLARASERRREIALRLALGAERGRLIRQLLTEALTLALVGGLAGMAVAWIATRGLARIAGGVGSVLGRDMVGLNAVSLSAIRLDGAVLLFALAASLVTGVLFGIVPALQATRSELTADLKHGSPMHAALRGFTTRNALVVVEIGLAFMLLVGSGLMLRSLSRLLALDAGVDPRNLLTVQVALGHAVEPEQSLVFWQELTRRAATLPGARSAALADCPPLIGYCNVRPLWLGEAGAGAPQPVGVHYVSPDYFNTLGVRLLSGRVFNDQDRAGSPPVVILNETAARKYFPGENAVGKRIAVGGGFADGADVIGVVGDQRFRALETPAEPDVYISNDQLPQQSGYLFVRTSGRPLALAGALRAAVQRLNPSLPVFDIQTMEQRMGTATARTRITGLLLTLFAVLSLVLAMIGIYGVVAHAVTQRTREIGVRIALGAERGNVIALILRYGLALAGTGLAAGVLGALGTTRVLRSMLYEVRPTDPVVFGLLAVLTVAVAVVASAVPAWRATRVDPLIALRSE